MGQFGQITHTHQYVSSALPTVANEPASPMRDVSEGEACPTESGFIADQDRATIAKSSTLPHDSAPREKFQAQEEKIVKLKERVKVLEDREDVAATQSGDDTPIKGRGINEGEATAERISNDSEEIARVLTSMDAAIVLAGRIDVPTGSGSIPTAGPPATIARDAEVARIHVEEELQGMTDSLDKSNETIAKYLQEYQYFASELPLEKRIELISDLVKYQDNYSKVYKFQIQQRRPMTKKQKKDYYMAMIKNNLGWKLVLVEDVYVQALQVKHPIIDWKVHTEGQISYWQIIRLGGSSACY
nr:hypothetical protein [Tanacetum cinerariifolium]